MRPATVVATTYCEMYSLSRADLEIVLQQWPELAEEFDQMSEWRPGEDGPDWITDPLLDV